MSSLKRSVRMRRMAASSSVSMSLMCVDSHHRFGGANLRATHAVRLAPLCHPPENHAIGEMPAVPCEQNTNGVRRRVRDVFRVGPRFLRDQAVRQQTSDEPLRAIGESNRVDAFERCHTFASFVFSSTPTLDEYAIRNEDLAVRAVTRPPDACDSLHARFCDAGAHRGSEVARNRRIQIDRGPRALGRQALLGNNDIGVSPPCMGCR
jgi:hypothetical protein